MRVAVMRAGLLLTSLLALGLASCLTSDPPDLKREDLVQVPALVGEYVATGRPEGALNQPQPADAQLQAASDGSYLLTFIEDGHADTPTRLRILALKSGAYLGVLTESDSNSAAMYAYVTPDSGSGWLFKVIDLRADKRTDALQRIVRRHGVQKITFDHDTADNLAGSLDARQLRALFADPDFIRATQSDGGFRLTRKQ